MHGKDRLRSAFYPVCPRKMLMSTISCEPMSVLLIKITLVWSLRCWNKICTTFWNRTSSNPCRSSTSGPLHIRSWLLYWSWNSWDWFMRIWSRRISCYWILSDSHTESRWDKFKIQNMQKNLWNYIGQNSFHFDEFSLFSNWDVFFDD